MFNNEIIIIFQITFGLLMIVFIVLIILNLQLNDLLGLIKSQCPIIRHDLRGIYNYNVKKLICSVATKGSDSKALILIILTIT